MLMGFFGYMEESAALRWNLGLGVQMQVGLTGARGIGLRVGHVE